MLRKMIRTAGIRDDDLVTLQLVGDLSYAWELVDTFTMDMQDGIKRDPALVGKLRATFLKVILGTDYGHGCYQGQEGLLTNF